MERQHTTDLSEEHFSTAPPSVVESGLRRRLGETLSATIMPLIKRAARPFLSGETIRDALCVSERLKGEGLAAALSYWDEGGESLEDIETIALAAIAALAATSPESYLSLKPPAVHFSKDAAHLLASAAAPHGLRLHFDSHGVDVADLQNAMMETMLETLRPECLGMTLPGRQLRSLQDADWAITRGLNLRVVKGEWPDPADPRRDLRSGFMAVIDHIAGRARHVAVATHDFALAREAVARLSAAATPCEIEVLLGMPAQAILNWAKANGVKVRVYVPYGRGFVANAVGILRRNPRLALAIARAQLAQFTA
jgi:proline dehydrogenase